MEKLIMDLTGLKVVATEANNEAETLTTIFENETISIEQTNIEGLLYVTNPSKDYETVGYFQEV